MKQRVIKNHRGQKLVYPTKPDIKIKNILSNEECDFIRSLTEHFPDDKSPLVQLRRQNKGLYEVDRQYWTFREHPHWFLKLHKKLCYYYDEKIHLPRHWHIMKYRKPGDGLGWHAEGRISYVSFSINLSNPDEHEGADFQLRSKPDLKLNKGDGIAYSGHSTHQVDPLRSGVKYSLVAWFKDNSRQKEMLEKPFPYENEKKT
tara:strand:+ start:98 stop:703 length:606 start_codon:yes stop_codon:yes gene_type:complete